MWVLTLLACEEIEEVSFSQFNQAEDHLVVSIGSETLPDTEISLYSSTGIVEVGTASISPGGAPAGTQHTLTVLIDDTYEDCLLYTSPSPRD